MADDVAVEFAIDVAAGPAAHFITGPVFRDRPVHTGIVLDAALVLSKPTEARRPDGWNPLTFGTAWLPRTIFLSPGGSEGTSMYGASWRPIGFDLPLTPDPAQLSVGMGVIVTYAWIGSDRLPSPTHFLRPGVDPTVQLAVPLSERWRVAFGWTSQLYVPQPVGGSILRVGPLDDAIWHIGQLWTELHLRLG